MRSRAARECTQMYISCKMLFFLRKTIQLVLNPMRTRNLRKDIALHYTVDTTEMIKIPAKELENMLEFHFARPCESPVMNTISDFRATKHAFYMQKMRKQLWIKKT